MNNNQQKVREFIQQNNLSTDIESRILDLVSELGEFSKEILKSTNYGKQDLKLTNNITEEFGDLYFTLLAIANNLDIDINQSLDLVLAKYKKRISSKGNPSSNK